jgi:hypothetical protein
MLRSHLGRATGTLDGEPVEGLAGSTDWPLHTCGTVSRLMKNAQIKDQLLVFDEL